MRPVQFASFAWGCLSHRAPAQNFLFLLPSASGALRSRSAVVQWTGRGELWVRQASLFEIELV